ncbi:TetR/AcrR family transcriptional regulator [Agrococcus jenensis]|uniref:TetR family transcriptional regulator n=1 Tax=Agrococcus jenensis TaxID=46353 RepID=A0A3N2ANS6_9MICO|nr:TetR family transcriptional regulator [Agrococcus jenensis]ROR64717.1 TetR family transcriptional regulator [Agrococcus jenensis]
MAWDPERTKRLLLDAGVVEFSAHGLAGARVDRIATAAGVNKERIYQYFGKKPDFFGAVLTHQLGLIVDAVPIRGTGIDAIADYAGRLFDYQCAHPELARLTFWEGLELGTPVAEEHRRARSVDKVDRVLAAVPELSREEAEELLLTILTLADGWQALPNLDVLYSGAEPGDTARLARRRSVITTIVRSWAPADASHTGKASHHIGQAAGSEPGVNAP